MAELITHTPTMISHSLQCDQAATTAHFSTIGSFFSNTARDNLLTFNEIESTDPVTLMIDLDETLIHSSFEKPEFYSFSLDVPFNNSVYTVYVQIRPGAEEFIRQLCFLSYGSLINKIAREDNRDNFMNYYNSIFQNGSNLSNSDASSEGMSAANGFNTGFLRIDESNFMQIRNNLNFFRKGVFDVFIFTASMPEYAVPVVQKLVPWFPTSHILTRQYCRIVNISGQNDSTSNSQSCPVIVKDLTVFKRDLARMIIVDNSAESFMLQPENGILASTWIGDVTDFTLLDNLFPMLTAVAMARDVRVAMHPSA
ncbi:hypothetical protein TRFO_14937 [Tritrichomonas foetus]|uniref:Mitochondrial import inner membrane translocase subunit TIM50 n=1 Tax=Tritrichomonas foetus TaxID=1144522 RepID=A0A1J4KYK1_9EUKA|nr:hypothetical protein TRFO_14937 [Tritrichomonas foetus]|eukprot:OHT14637.1 hypothetical protein TRFO_14937 [Tritrichomonas foetus]